MGSAARRDSPTKDKIAFLKNLTRHMIGDLGQADTSLLDNILVERLPRSTNEPRSAPTTRRPHTRI